MRWILLSLLILLVACSPQNVSNTTTILPTPTPSPEPSPTPTPIVISKLDTLTVGNDEVYIYTDNLTSTVYNCGSEPYGYEVQEYLRDKKYNLTTLIVTNASDNNIGGCRYVLLWYTLKIEKLIIYSPSYSDLYNRTIGYVSPSKVVLKDEAFVCPAELTETKLCKEVD